ncbi:beta-L-arabinofuranosidase domain-containing protein [Streptomyces litchfieldiae]|uniref:Glycoside hydrolase family 127 protein n=1 Tax=Streptomyces litchfieldiae TaxID=3075543 RepID=A0ABU2MS94_9ACTN|nr:beta-L-arabinofuranosidase domain-containing protein [Streptomyces sp. DSM 44938]MDT0344512.1 glycoside hydrolase family 127 protein [Streptomyces sp. DSM 44938]
MHEDFSRRTLLGLTLAAAPSLAVASATPAASAARPAAPATPAGALPAPPNWAARPFALDQVRLEKGVFSRKRDLMLEYLRDYPADRILAVFRANAGLDTRGAEPPGGWETADGNLRGHYAGHFVTCVAQAYAGGAGDSHREKLDYLVAALGECQDALAAREGPDRPSHPGYLAAYPEDQFVLLESYTTYPTIWAPWYTCHKIMRGLLDAHTLAGNEQALDIVTRMGEWAHSRLSVLPREQLDRMWSLYIAGEYGGMNEVMADLHALTGRREFLDTARCFDNTRLIEDTAAGRDTLTGIHANQHIPQFLGYTRVFDQDPARAHYLVAARNFWSMVVDSRLYSIGGTGKGEKFTARDAIAGTLGEDNAETCATYNMLKLTRSLFLHEPDAAHMDYYERGLFNQILGSRADRRSTSEPLVTYFIGQGPGVRRQFGNTGTCCGGTGMENHTKYQESVYFRSADDRALYVNLYLASTLHWAERGLVIRQRTRFPEEPGSTLTVEGGGELDIRLRVPAWAANGFTVEINGVVQDVPAAPGTYVSLTRHWSDGDVIGVSMPFALRVERTPDDPAVQSLFYGPVLLVVRDPADTFREFSFYRDFTMRGDLADAVRPAGAPLHFTTHGRTLAPFHLGDDGPFHAYFKRSEPVIAFRGADSGVPNRAREDGVTFLDRLWGGAPFGDHAEFRRAVRAAGDEWRGLGLLSGAELRRVTAAADRARLSG